MSAEIGNGFEVGDRVYFVDTETTNFGTPNIDNVGVVAIVDSDDGWHSVLFHESQILQRVHEKDLMLYKDYIKNYANKLTAVTLDDSQEPEGEPDEGIQAWDEFKTLPRARSRRGGASDEELEKLLDEPDMVNHPPHYTQHPSGVECIEIVRWMNYNLGNVTKYVWRAGLKGGEDKEIEDLEKALFYIQDEIRRRKGEF